MSHGSQGWGSAASTLEASMLRVLAWGAQVALLALAGYEALVSCWGWKDRATAPRGAGRNRLRVVIPAHNEEAVIAGVLEDLAAQDYAGPVEVWVIADRCSDSTATLARSSARVVEREEGPDGKGAALGWYLEQHPLSADEALVVLDADNRVSQHFLSRLSDELAAGHQALQAYLDVANPDDSFLATASALTYWSGNRMVQHSRTRLGWSADLGGTGMCVTAGALEAAGGFGASLTEDRDLAARLGLAGIRVVWLHDVRIRDEKPPSLGAAMGQRARWVAGKRAATKNYLGPLLRAGLRQRDPALLDQAVRLIQPGRSFVALVSGALTVAAAVTRTDWLLPWPVLAAATGVQLALPVGFLLRDRVPLRYLARYPLVALLAGLWLPIRLLSRLTGRRWYHTTHRG